MSDANRPDTRSFNYPWQVRDYESTTAYKGYHFSRERGQRWDGVSVPDDLHISNH
jgi:hypothetical protein